MILSAQVLEYVAAAALVAGGLVYQAEKPALRRWLTAHTTAAERQEAAQLIALAKALAPGAVLYIEHTFPEAAGIEKFLQAVARLRDKLQALTQKTLPPSVLEGLIQEAYALAVQNGTLQASQPKTQATP
ncbi:MAG: hypothetical protein K6U87_10265 [Firmicutes bacterium]|nr:hypothetical protein [Bacillota bacterium]